MLGAKIELCQPGWNPVNEERVPAKSTSEWQGLKTASVLSIQSGRAQVKQLLLLLSQPGSQPRWWGINRNVKEALGSDAGRAVSHCWKPLAGSQLAGLLPACLPVAVGPDGWRCWCSCSALGKRRCRQPSLGRHPGMISLFTKLSGCIFTYGEHLPSAQLPGLEQGCALGSGHRLFLRGNGDKEGFYPPFTIRVRELLLASCNFNQSAFIIRDVKFGI